jgi:acylphosphatase
MSGGKVFNVTFEIFGKVQGVFFRKHTEQRARELGLVGWVENTTGGSVRGQAQGREADVAAMRKWLAETG